MVDKKQKIDFKQLLQEVADKFNLKVVSKETKEAELVLPKGSEKYESMNSRDLAMEIKELESEIRHIEEVDQKIRNDVSRFMSDRGPDKFTQRIFDGRNVDPRKLTIQDMSHTLKTNLKIHLERLFQTKLESELTDNFLTKKDEYKGIITNIEIRPTPTGEMLVVHIGEEDKPEDIDIDEDKPKGREGVTSSASVPKASDKTFDKL